MDRFLQEVTDEAHGSSFLEHEYSTEHRRQLSQEGRKNLRRSKGLFSPPADEVHRALELPVIVGTDYFLKQGEHRRGISTNYAY
jgi:hypothetical protein